MNQIVKYLPYQKGLLDELLNSTESSLAGIMDDISFATEASEIMFISSYPPRECGIATYSQDLIQAIENKFGNSVPIRICAVESETDQYRYGSEVSDVLCVNDSESFENLLLQINGAEEIRLVLIQHEFGLFQIGEENFMQFLERLNKPIVLVFHTILPNPDEIFRKKVIGLASVSSSVIVMTKAAQHILCEQYDLDSKKITVIPHGTHLVPNGDKIKLKQKYNLSGKKVLATFGLLNSGKGIENTLLALPSIIKKHPDVLFLIIGKTHPSVVKHEGEIYRNKLIKLIEDLKLGEHVRFINNFLPLYELLDYLQLSDIYLFTSTDPNQAVSGTFSYAMSSGCPIISTPFPHAVEVLTKQDGIIVDFNKPKQLAKAAIHWLDHDQLRLNISMNALQRMASTAWENAALAHVELFGRIGEAALFLDYKTPPIKLDHIKKMTTDFGMIQFSIINRPDLSSGYTLDDNARALIAMCMHFELTEDKADLIYIDIYLRFIEFCLLKEGDFLNYVDENHQFTDQNYTTSLEDSNGRAIWALGYLVSLERIVPQVFINRANYAIDHSINYVCNFHSTRAISFIIKGLHYRSKVCNLISDVNHVSELANRLVEMYKHESDGNWNWYESYLTYANSVIPEALLCAWLTTENPIYKKIAKNSFDFLMSKIFQKNQIRVVSNKGWLHKGKEDGMFLPGGEQAIDVAYSIIALEKFYGVFKNNDYLKKLEYAFSWFLGNNHLNQIVYNPCTGGCYDGVEESDVNLNQGAESSLSYLLARLILEKTKISEKKELQEVRFQEKGVVVWA